MAVHSDSDFRDDFLEGAAKAFFCTAYADYCARPGGGKDWINFIPDTLPGNAYALAGELWAGLTTSNDVGVYSLALQAQGADETPDLDASEFGHYLAMAAMGHGVSWFDDHAEFPLEVPSIECSAYTFDPAAYSEGL